MENSEYMHIEYRCYDSLPCIIVIAMFLGANTRCQCDRHRPRMRVLASPMVRVQPFIYMITLHALNYPRALTPPLIYSPVAVDCCRLSFRSRIT